MSLDNHHITLRPVPWRVFVLNLLPFVVGGTLGELTTALLGHRRFDLGELASWTIGVSIASAALSAWQLAANRHTLAVADDQLYFPARIHRPRSTVSIHGLNALPTRRLSVTSLFGGSIRFRNADGTSLVITPVLYTASARELLDTLFRSTKSAA